MPQPCPSCGAENAERAKFCGECGGAMAPGARASSSGRLAPVADAAGERRLVSVLFADVKDYTRLSERLDPEQVQELVGGLLGVLSEIVARQGGFVDKFMGDSLMALFGAPKSYGDDAERAVACAAELQRAAAQYSAGGGELGLLQIRVGIATGEVMAGALGQRGEYTAVGDAVNTANRIQSVGEPGSVLICESTAQAVRTRYRLTPQEPVTLKGKSEPLVLYRVEGPLRATEHFLGRFVGRRDELSWLAEAWRELADGKGLRMFLARGEAGIGKSRLGNELRRQLAFSGARPTRLSARFTALGMEPMQGPRQLARAALGANADTPEEELRGRIAQAAARSVSADEQAFFTEQILFLLGMAGRQSGLAESQRVEIALMSLRRMIEALCTQTPALIVLEDLQWADAETLALLARLARSPFEGRALLLALARPEVNEVLGGLAGDFTVLELAPLPADELAVLSEGVLAGAAAAPELSALLADRSGGNPFLYAELLRSLRDAGKLAVDNGRYRLSDQASAETLPTGVRSVLAARLDALGAEQRAVVGGVSVLGRDFTQDAAALLCGEGVEAALAALVSRGVLVDLGREKGKAKYQFCHALLQEVAYQGLLKRDREAMHKRAAEFYRPAINDFEAADYGLLSVFGYHCEHSGEPALAAQAYFSAGLLMYQDGSNAVARQRFLAARQLALGCEPMPALKGLKSGSSLAEILLYLCSVCRAVGNLDEADQYCGEVLSVRGADARQRAAAHMNLSQNNLRRAKFDEALRHADLALDLEEGHAELEHQQHHWLIKARVLVFLGRMDEALEITRMVEAKLEQPCSIHGYDCRHIRGQILHARGGAEQAAAAFEQAMEIAGKLGRDGLRASASVGLATALLAMRRPEEARRHLESSTLLYKQRCDAFNIAACGVLMSHVHRMAGRHAEAIASAESARDRANEISYRHAAAAAEIMIAYAHAQAANHIESLHAAQLADTHCKPLNSPQLGVQALVLAAAAAQITGNGRQGDYLRQAREINAPLKNRRFEHMARLIEGREQLQAGDIAAARREFGEVLEAARDASLAALAGAACLGLAWGALLARDAGTLAELLPRWQTAAEQDEKNDPRHRATRLGFAAALAALRGDAAGYADFREQALAHMPDEPAHLATVEALAVLCAGGLALKDGPDNSAPGERLLAALERGGRADFVTALALHARVEAGRRAGREIESDARMLEMLAQKLASPRLLELLQKM